MLGCVSNCDCLFTVWTSEFAMEKDKNVYNIDLTRMWINSVHLQSLSLP